MVKRKASDPVPAEDYAQAFSDACGHLHPRVHGKLATKFREARMMLFTSSGRSDRMVSTIVGPGLSNSSDPDITSQRSARRQCLSKIVRAFMYPRRSNILLQGRQVSQSMPPALYRGLSMELSLPPAFIY